MREGIGGRAAGSVLRAAGGLYVMESHARLYMVSCGTTTDYSAPAPRSVAWTRARGGSVLWLATSVVWVTSLCR